MHADIHLMALAPRAVDELRDDTARPPLARTFRMQVIHDDGNARALRDVDRLNDRVDVRELPRIDVGRRFLRRARELPFRVLTLAAQMRLIMAAVRRDDLGQLQHLFFSAPAAGHILESGGEAEGALVHALPNELLPL